MLDDGRLTDNKGRTVDFRNTIVIMTSNLGSDLISRHYEQTAGRTTPELVEACKRDVMGLLRQTIRPEFLNRIDEIVMFTPLSHDDIERIVSLQFAAVARTLAKNGISISITPAATSWIADAGFDAMYGARPVKRALQTYVLNDLSRQILADTVSRDRPVVVDAAGGHLVFSN